MATLRTDDELASQRLKMQWLEPLPVQISQRLAGLRLVDISSSELQWLASIPDVLGAWESNHNHGAHLVKERRNLSELALKLWLEATGELSLGGDSDAGGQLVRVLSKLASSLVQPLNPTSSSPPPPPPPLQNGYHATPHRPLPDYVRERDPDTYRDRERQQQYELEREAERQRDMRFGARPVPDRERDRQRDRPTPSARSYGGGPHAGDVVTKLPSGASVRDSRSTAPARSTTSSASSTSLPVPSLHVAVAAPRLRPTSAWTRREVTRRSQSPPPPPALATLDQQPPRQQHQQQQSKTSTTNNKNNDKGIMQQLLPTDDADDDDNNDDESSSQQGDLGSIIGIQLTRGRDREREQEDGAMD